MMNNEIDTIKKWFNDAKPNPTIEDICTQIGCHLEEVSEMADSLGEGDLSYEIGVVSALYKIKPPSFIDELGAVLKDKESSTELLDSLCDQIVTAIGVAELAGFDIKGALNEVIASNDSKRLDDGSFPLDENGKITKASPNFFPPNLEKFI